MVARAKANRWLGVVAGLMLPAAGVAAAGEVTARPAGRGEDLLVAQALPRPSRTHAALNDAIESYRRGDYETAARQFKQAQDGWDDLSGVQRADLTKFLQANNTALQRRAEAADHVGQAEQAERSGRGAEALDLAQKALGNPYAAPAVKQKAQALVERLRSRPASAVPGGTLPATSPPALGQSKLTQARQLLAEGNFDAAEQLAREAERMGVSATPGDDSPRKVLDDISKSRTDPRALLTAARAAFHRGDLDRAEALARASEKAEPAWAIHLWGDSPAKVLKDVQAVRGTPVVKAEPEAPAKGSMMDSLKGLFISKKQEVPPSGPETAPRPPVDPGKAAHNLESARQLLKKGRKALADGQIDQARDCAQKAEALKANLEWYDDTPAKLLADVQRAEAARAPAGAGGAPREDPRAILTRGRKACEEGRLDEALQLAQKAKAAPGASWGLFDRDTPDKLINDVKKAQTKRDQEEAARLLAEGRKLRAQGDLDGASKAALRAQHLHGPYSVWDLGDRPAKLLDDIDAARKKGRKPAVPPVPPAGVAHGESGAGRWPVASGAREQARQMLAEARQLQAQGRLAEARARALEAQRLPAVFGPDEDRPEKALLELAGLARRQIDTLVGQADEHVKAAQRDSQAYLKADTCLAQAQALAQGFQLDTHMIDSKLAWVRQARAQAGLASVAPAPGGPSGVMPVKGDPAGPKGHGAELLDKARLEIKAGNTTAARRLAEQVYTGPYGLKEQAAAMLRSIDNEEFEQKKSAARRTFDAGNQAFRRGDYAQASAILRAVDPALLDAERQARLRDLMSVPQMQPQDSGIALSPAPPGPKPPVGGDSREADYLKQVQAMQELKFQKLRDQGLTAQEEAGKSFRAGDMERALDVLQQYLSLLPDSGLEPDRTNLLRRPVEARLQQYKTLKAQKDFATAQERVKQAGKDRITQKQLAEHNKQKRIQELMARYNTLLKESKYAEAESLAMQVLDLDPDNATAAVGINLARMRRRVSEYNKIKDEKEAMFVEAANESEREGPHVSPRNPIKFDDGPIWDYARKRKPLPGIGGLKSEKQREIERRLLSPVNMSFENMPLGRALDDLQTYHGINIVPDRRALDEAGITLDRPVTIKLDNVSLQSALRLLLDQVKLTYVIDNEVVKVTTQENARGKLQRGVFQVAELVIPVDNYGSLNTPGMNVPPPGGTPPSTPPNLGTTPYAGAGSMTTSGTSVGSPGSGFASSPTAMQWSKSGASQTREDQLIQLITNTIEPKSWASMGGQGTIDYYPMALTLVINQTPDILEQVADLLNALRRLQDAEVALEVRLISIAEGFFERIGLDFNINIKNDKQTQRFEPLITSGQFKPAGYLNDFSPDRFIAGLTPAGTFTSDLDIPIRTSSFGMAVPPFGGFPNIPGGNGGIELGLAFLSDIQVFMFMEAAQGDQRTNVMQAPKLTMFNGQTATLTVFDQQYFVLNTTVINNAGQLTFLPQNTPIPTGGVNVTMQAVISADRRFVRINANLALTNLASAVVPLFPVPVVITPTFEGGFQGQPVVFTQFLQQPVFNTVSVQTSVAVPDGGTVLLGGLKRLSEGRNEFGPPVLSKVPYINRLFKNVGYGREVQNLLMMITPRIIINEEEEERQTGLRPGARTEAFGGGGS